MSEHSLHRRILSGETGLWATPVRGILGAAEWVYATGIRRRNRAFDAGQGVHQIDAPVISVGNITVGGTGKTPMVIHVASRLEQMGGSPAVVARGYGAEDGDPNDEERLIRARVPGVSYVADRDRVRGAEHAIKHKGADVIVLDDAFQHRRLARDLDIVLVDATCPFGFDHLLPRGLLREPAASLARADLIVLTRCDQVASGGLDRLVGQIGRIKEALPILKCCHAVSEVVRLNGSGARDQIDGLRVVAFAGIGQPRGFLTTLRSLGCDVVGQRWWPDHHEYRKRDLDDLLRIGRFPDHDALVTTEKDAVKLQALPVPDQANILVVRVRIDFMDGGCTILDELLARVMGLRRVAVASESAS